MMTATPFSPRNLVLVVVFVFIPCSWSTVDVRLDPVDRGLGDREVIEERAGLGAHAWSAPTPRCSQAGPPTGPCGSSGPRTRPPPPGPSGSSPATSPPHTCCTSSHPDLVGRPHRLDAPRRHTTVGVGRLEDDHPVQPVQLLLRQRRLQRLQHRTIRLRQISRWTPRSEPPSTSTPRPGCWSPTPSPSPRSRTPTTTATATRTRTPRSWPPDPTRPGSTAS